MMSPLIPNPKREALRKDLRTWIVGRTITFAATITERFEDSCDQSTQPVYRRLFSIGPPRATAAHLNQMLLGLGALLFFVHALDRFSFRPDSQALSEAIFDPTTTELLDWFGEMISKYAGMGSEPETELVTTAKADMQKLFNLSQSKYAAAPSLLGKSAEDRNSAVWLAACTIAEDVGHPKELVLVYSIKTELMQGLIDMNLVNRLKELEALL
jgi:hypothetical protein